MAKKTIETVAKKTNVWKILSITFVVLFALVLLVGLWKAYHFRSSFKSATTAQMDTAKTIAMNSLASKGENVSNYIAQISDNIRPINVGSERKSSIEVSLNNESVHNLYIIDVDSGNILMYNRMEFYDGMNHSLDHPQEMRRRDFGTLFGLGGPREAPNN